MNFKRIAVIGGGPAGMMAAIAAAETGVKTCLFERNQDLGKKLLLTGKGRCNLTTNRSIPEIVETFGRKGKFLYSALSRFSNEDLVKFFNGRGVTTKLERGGRIFPISGTAATVLKCLKNELVKKKVNIYTGYRIVKITPTDHGFNLFSENKKSFIFSKVVIATGGKSYPSTGSTGDGYALAATLGHKITPCRAALVPLIIEDRSLHSLSGLTLKNIRLTFFADGQPFISLFGEMLFTHKGISGPIVLTTSKAVGKQLDQKKQVTAVIDLKPALDLKKLKNRIYRDIQRLGKKEFKSLLKELLPKSLIDLAIKRTGIDKHQKNAGLNKENVGRLLNFLKNFNFAIKGTAPIKEAIVTAGGVAISQLDSRTMESKVTPGVYFAGEIIDLDGPSGGFNLQKAFSTGWLAGYSAKNLDNS